MTDTYATESFLEKYIRILFGIFKESGEEPKSKLVQKLVSVDAPLHLTDLKFPDTLEEVGKFVKNRKETCDSPEEAVVECVFEAYQVTASSSLTKEEIIRSFALAITENFPEVEEWEPHLESYYTLEDEHDFEAAESLSAIICVVM